MTLMTARIRDMYTWAFAWRAEDGDGKDLSRLRASNEAEFDGWLAAHDAEIAATITTKIRQNCTPSYEAYRRGGDFLIEAVADWIDNPPEWVDAPWRSADTQEGTK